VFLAYPASDGSRALIDREQCRAAGIAAADLASKEIAERLGLSPRTVSTHLHHNISRAQVHLRPAAVTRPPLPGMPAA
jgi:DNA-binding CsgD family transcriptional regulator